MHTLFRLHKKKHNRKGNTPFWRNMKWGKRREDAQGLTKLGIRGVQKRVTLINGQSKSLTKDSKELRVNYAEIWRKNVPIRENSKLKFLRQEVVYFFQRNFKEASGTNRVSKSDGSRWSHGAGEWLDYAVFYPSS